MVSLYSFITVDFCSFYFLGDVEIGNAAFSKKLPELVGHTLHRELLMSIQILTAVAALCIGNRICIEKTFQCIDDFTALELSEYNICQKAHIFCDDMKETDGDRILKCWKSEGTHQGTAK